MVFIVVAGWGNFSIGDGGERRRIVASVELGDNRCSGCLCV